jgi:hypothetical protein
MTVTVGQLEYFAAIVDEGPNGTSPREPNPGYAPDR